MKKVFFLVTILLSAVVSNPMFSQSKEEPESLGLPGDNFNLYAVLDVFQNSKTLEEFEKAVNDQEKNINNLDLDNDGSTDYVRVISSKEGKSHTIVLQVSVTATEQQDIAVIDVNTNKDGKIRVQIIGDEALYGKNYIVEPSNSQVKGTPNPGYTGGDVTINNTYNYSNDLYAANSWPIVTYMYAPYYSVWISPWYWGFYPPYFRPWRPIPYYSYWGFHSHYYGHGYYRRAPRVNYPVHHSHYSNNRRSSAVVTNNNRGGNYKGTYEGKDFKRPTTPINGSNGAAVNRPSTKPSVPSSRPSVPSTRPATRPTTPTARPTTPTARPTTRPSMPTTRPSVPYTRPSMPTSRPMSRPAGGRGRG